MYPPRIFERVKILDPHFTRSLTMSKARCWGHHGHKAGCRPGRPLCRWRRTKCDCPAYHFPHRDGGGRCGHPERMQAAWGVPS
jgi:hypothetical protein